MKRFLSVSIVSFLFACQPASQEDGLSNASEELKNERPESMEGGQTGNQTTSETFMGFFENFMWDKDFQKSRIEFPVTLNEGVIDSGESWEHRGFYTTKSFMPVLHTDTTGQDVSEQEVVMSTVSFKEQKAENYFFAKRDNAWRLQKINFQSIDSLADSGFLRFLERFSTDSAFQVKHISFPLPNYYADYDNDYETVYDSLRAENWRYLEITGIEGIMTLNSNTGSDIRSVFFRGIENGIHVRYLFKRRGNSWELIMREDYST